MTASTFRLLRALYYVLKTLYVLGPGGTIFLFYRLDFADWCVFVVRCLMLYCR